MMKKYVKKTLMFLGLNAIACSQVQADANFCNPCQPVCAPVCAPTCTPCCDPCATRFWGEAEYLYWQIQDSPSVAPLVTSSTTTIAAPGTPGVPGDPTLGVAGQTVVLGGKKITNDWSSGGRFSAGYWFDDCMTWAGEVNYFFLGENSKTSTVASTGLAGTPSLTIPFINVLTTPFSEASSTLATSAVGGFSGTARLKVTNRLQGAELNAIWKYLNCECYSVNLIGGFRWMNFQENMTFSTNNLNTAAPAGTFITTDHFNAENNFYGAQIGIDGKYNYNNFFVKGKVKVALGAMCSNLHIKGNLLTNEFLVPAFVGTPVNFPAGYFAAATNSGKHDQTHFSVVPEFDIQFGYQITNNFNITVGYNFLYASEMTWATNQIDRRINLLQVPAIDLAPGVVLPAGSPAFPQAQHKTDGFFAQGVTVGLEYSF